MVKQKKFLRQVSQVVDEWAIKEEFTVYEVCCLHYGLNPDDAILELEPARVEAEAWADDFGHLYLQLEADQKAGDIGKLTKKSILEWYNWKGLKCPDVFKSTGHKSPKQLKAAKRKPTSVTEKRMATLNALLNAMDTCLKVNNYPRLLDRSNLPFSRAVMYDCLKKRSKHFNITFTTFEQFWKEYATDVCKLHRGTYSDGLTQDAKFIRDKLNF